MTEPIKLLANFPADRFYRPLCFGKRCGYLNQCCKSKKACLGPSEKCPAAIEEQGNFRFKFQV